MAFVFKYRKFIIGVIVFIGVTWYMFHIPNAEDVSKTEEGEIRVMSYNIRYGWSDYDEWLKRKDLLVSQILDYRPDSIGIQEGDSF